MQINDLSPKYGLMNHEERKAFILSYRIRRDFDMSKSPKLTKGKKRGEFKLPRLLKKTLKSDVMKMLKVLEINVNDINRLRQEAFSKGFTRKEDFL